MEWLLIRHAEAAGDPYAETEPPAEGFLSPKGEKQAEALARKLAQEPVDEVWSSPYGRALRTATIAFPGQQVRILDFLKEWIPSPELRGADATVWEAMNRRIGETWAEDTWQTPLGEGCLQMLARVGPPFFSELKTLGIHARHGGFVLEPGAEGRRLAIVAHGGSLAALLGFILGLPPFPVARFSMGLTGCARIKFQLIKDVWHPQLVLL